MKQIKIIYLLMVIILAFSGCAKDGETGPQGPAGTNGTSGNANVISKTFTVTNWAYVVNHYEASLVDSDITQDILDKGMVIVYITFSNGTYYQLPYTLNPSASYSSTIMQIVSLNAIDFRFTYSDLAAHIPPVSSTFKVVVASGLAREENPTLNWLNYDEVKSKFNLTD